MPLAIIIPTYNSSDYIADCINSIAAQTVRPDMVLVVDDMSTDITKAVAQTKLEQSGLPGMIFELAGQKHNIGFSRNYALTQALRMGIENIMMVDSDDVLDPEYVANMWQTHLDNPDAQWVTSSYKHMNGPFVDLMDGATAEQEYEQNRLSAFILAHPGFLLQYGGYSPLAIAEDWELWHRLLKFGNKYAVNHKGGYNYRIHPKSSTAQKNGNVINENTINYINAQKFTW